jgi:hypothetical protein
MNEILETELVQEEPQALEAVSRAEIDIQIKTARTYPRPALSKIKERVLSDATLDEDSAASCFYKLPRGGGMIDGPSVRLAEIVAGRYGNLRVATRVTETVTIGDNPHVVVQVGIHDLENNLAITVEKRRRITGKKSKGGKPDEDDINLATNACASIAFRDGVFRIVPASIVNPAFEACKKVAAGNASSLSEKRLKLLARLAQMGVSQDRVLNSLKVKKVEDITLEHVEDLQGRGTALKDGGTVEEVFPVDASTAPAHAAPANAPAPEASKPELPKGGSATAPDQELAEFVTGNGFTFDEFRKWGKESGNIPDADSLASFADLDLKACIRFLRSPGGLLKGLKAVKGTA